MNYDALSELDPDHITVAAVWEVFPIWPKWLGRYLARLTIDTCVRRGEFIRNADGTARLNSAAFPESRREDA